jgi:DNA-binding PadR family transcriptional regulator
MEKQFKVYQITNNGKWWLKEVVSKNDGTISFLNTYDEKEATILSASKVNEILYRVQTETNANIADIYTLEVRR